MFAGLIASTLIDFTVAPLKEVDQIQCKMPNRNYLATIRQYTVQNAVTNCNNDNLVGFK